MIPRIQELARQHAICASLIYRSRRKASPQVGSAWAVQLVAVWTSSEKPIGGLPTRPRHQPNGAGTIEIDFIGGVRVRVRGEVSLPALRRVIAAVRG
jgi:hypothetical protein